jgi:soluble lytic murein transglycosylase-like protein
VRKILGISSAVLLWAGLSLAATADTVHQTGAYPIGGQTVNSYSNAGAQEYYRTMRSTGGGTIYNVQPPPQLRPRRSSAPANLTIPSTVSFASSVKQDLDERWITIGNSRHEIAAIVEKEAKRFNLDPLLIEEVIRQESNFQPTATSPVGAQGLMQLMPGTAAMLGVRNSNDPADNIAGGSRYLAEQLSTFGRLDLALAAYNAGPGAVSSYGGVPPYAETQNYVARIVNSYNNRVQQERAKKGKNG